MSETLAMVLARIDRENAVNCTGPGEVGCYGRKGWHSWTDHRLHVAESQVAAFAEVLTADATRAAVDAAIDDHKPGADWHCTCGADLFGGSAAYSWTLFREHLGDAALAAIHTALGVEATP